MAIVGPDNRRDSFDVGAGQVVFVPQSYYHYFENVGDEPLHMRVAFNDSASEGSDDIGIGESIAGLPDRVMAAVFGTSVQTFAAIPKPQVKAIIVQPATIEDGCE